MDNLSEILLIAAIVGFGLEAFRVAFPPFVIGWAGLACFAAAFLVN